MYLFLLKKALPFTLTFILGAALSAVVGLFGAAEKKTETFFGSRSCDYSKRSRMRRQHLVAETRPLIILYKPDAVLHGAGALKVNAEPVKVRVTFGADGRVQGVEPVAGWCANGRERGQESLGASGWEAVGRAARQIEFRPETVNGMPVTVEREVEIRFLPE